jgi:hypothetical protein
MSKATEVVQNAKQLGRSITASAVAGLVIFIPFSEWLITVAPDQYDAQIRAVSVGAATALVALRTAYAWLDKGNLSFGRVDPTKLPDEFNPELDDEIPDNVLDPQLNEDLLPDEEALPKDDA